MVEKIRNLEDDGDILELAKTCPNVLSVVRLLFQRSLTQDPDLGGDQNPGYSATWFRNNGLGTAVQTLLDAEFVEIRGDRILLSTQRPIPSLSVGERVGELAAEDRGVQTVYNALLLGITQTGDQRNCLFLPWLEERGLTEAAKLLLSEGIICREKDLSHGELFVLA